VILAGEEDELLDVAVCATDSGRAIALGLEDEGGIDLALEVRVQFSQVRERSVTVVRYRKPAFDQLDALEVQRLAG